MSASLSAALQMLLAGKEKSCFPKFLPNCFSAQSASETKKIGCPYVQGLRTAQRCSPVSLKAWRGWSDLPRVPSQAEGMQGPVCPVRQKSLLSSGEEQSRGTEGAITASDVLCEGRFAV